MTRAIAIWFAIMAFVMFMIVTALPAHSYSCADIRQAYLTYGAAQLWRWARQYQVSQANRRAAVACIMRRR